MNGQAVGQTFEILYQEESVLLNDVIHFRVSLPLALNAVVLPVLLQINSILIDGFSELRCNSPLASLLSWSCGLSRKRKWGKNRGKQRRIYRRFCLPPLMRSRISTLNFPSNSPLIWGMTSKRLSTVSLGEFWASQSHRPKVFTAAGRFYSNISTSAPRQSASTPVWLGWRKNRRALHIQSACG